MTSYREARERVVELDKECRKALGHSDVTVKQYIPPNTPMYMTEIAIISATFLAYSQRWWFAAGGPVGHIWPAFARFSWAIQPWVIGLMVLIHGTEAVHFASSRLLHHSVNPRSRVFWLWAASFFIEVCTGGQKESSVSGMRGTICCNIATWFSSIANTLRFGRESSLSGVLMNT